MDPFRIRVRPEWIRSEYVFDPSGFDPNKRYFKLIKDLFHIRFSTLNIKILFISVFAKKIF